MLQTWYSGIENAGLFSWTDELQEFLSGIIIQAKVETQICVYSKNLKLFQ